MCFAARSLEVHPPLGANHPDACEEEAPRGARAQVTSCP